MTSSAELPIPETGHELVEAKVGRKDVRIIWDLGRETVHMGHRMRLVARLWIYDSPEFRDLTASLTQEYSISSMTVSGMRLPMVTLLEESRQRFSPRSLAELERRLQDPDVLEVFDPAAAREGA